MILARLNLSTSRVAYRLIWRLLFPGYWLYPDDIVFVRSFPPYFYYWCMFFLWEKDFFCQS